MERIPSREAKPDLRLNVIIIVVWVVVFCTAFIYSFPSILNGDLGDNDNYMRLHQVSTFIQSPSLYQLPLERFNPEDGRVMHWSRIVDVPVALVIWLTGYVVSEPLAVALSLFFVPTLYFLGLLYLMARLTSKIFGVYPAVIVAIFAPFSIVYAKFAPGYIDHHNLQLLLFILFLNLVPFSENKQVSAISRGVASGCVMAASLLIGLEAIPAYFCTLLTGMCFLTKQRGLDYSWVYLGYTGITCALVGLLGLTIFEPMEVILEPVFDVATYPLFLLSLVVGITFIVGSRKGSVLFTLTLILACIVGSLFLFPDMLASPYQNYPRLLSYFWLDHVSEAKPLISYMLSGGQLTVVLIAVCYIVITTASIVTTTSTHQKWLWMIAFLLLLPLLFWQLRLLPFYVLVSLPLQANLIYALYSKITTRFIRLTPFMLAMPTIVVPIMYNSAVGSEPSQAPVSRLWRLDAVEVLNKNQLREHKILTSLETASPILALTENSVISGPYHRNVNGNTKAIEAFSTHTSAVLANSLKQQNISLIIVDKRDPQLSMIAKATPPTSLVNMLLSGQVPEWLSYVDGNEQGLAVYQLKGLNNDE
ncbi:hypothetical protein [Vibrio maritimus]|uniref:hypothetical protein n=1 Tax=Vibrio maritimus TaxID=990268 RepID=UPI003736F625